MGAVFLRFAGSINRISVALAFLLQLVFSLPLFSQAGTNNLLRQLAQADEDQKAGIFNQLSELNSENASDQAILYAESALKLAQEHEDRQNEALAYQNLCLGYLYNDIYDKALVNGLAALEIFEELGDPEDRAYILSTLGWLYYDIQNADLALSYHQKVLDLYLQLNDQDKVALGYNSIGLAHSMKNENETALSFFLQSLKVAQENDIKPRMSAAHSNLGMTYSSLGSYELALEHLRKALELREGTSSVLSIAEIYNQIGKTYTGVREFEKAAHHLDTARAYIDQSTSIAAREKLMDNFEYCAQLFAAQGSYQQAFHALNEYSELRNLVLSEEKSNKLSEMRLLYETEKRESEIAQLEAQKKIDRLVRFSAIIALGLLSLIGYLTLRNLRNKHLKARLEKEALGDKLAFKNNELTTFALHIAQRNEWLSTFMESLDGIRKKADKSSADQIRKLLQQIEQSRSANQDLEAFHLNVENEYKDFFYQLSKRFPNLTENDKRLSAQLRLNLSTKDIAALNNISIKSVEMARYRLRKKLDLDPKESLNSFLATL